MTQTQQRETLEVLHRIQVSLSLIFFVHSVKYRHDEVKTLNPGMCIIWGNVLKKTKTNKRYSLGAAEKRHIKKKNLNQSLVSFVFKLKRHQDPVLVPVPVPVPCSCYSSPAFWLQPLQTLTGWSQPRDGTARRSWEQSSHTPWPQARQWWMERRGENSRWHSLQEWMSWSGTQ